MKITIEPTEQLLPGIEPHRTVTLSLPDDDMSLKELLDNILKPALKAWGFSEALLSHIEYDDTHTFP